MNLFYKSIKFFFSLNTDCNVLQFLGKKSASIIVKYFFLSANLFLKASRNRVKITNCWIVFKFVWFLIIYEKILLMVVFVSDNYEALYQYGKSWTIFTLFLLSHRNISIITQFDTLNMFEVLWKLSHNFIDRNNNYFY